MPQEIRTQIQKNKTKQSKNAHAGLYVLLRRTHAQKFRGK